MIVTIDGPAGAGKSSAARALAQRLGFEFLDTGAMYRAVTLVALRGQHDLGDERLVERLLDGMRLEMPAGRVLLNGADVSEAIRKPEVTTASREAANSLVVRRRLVAWQRALAGGRNMVCEGRDQGTIVFPDAVCKFFLKADPYERARRRHRELAARGETLSLEQVLEEQQARDRRDAARNIAPMIPAGDAVILDSTYFTQEQVVAQMEQEVRKRLNPTHGHEVST